jgi:RNA polymerase sigma-70 factor (ECF subfamily)
MKEYIKAKEKGFEEKDLIDVLIVEKIKSGSSIEQGKLYSKYYKVILTIAKKYTNGDLELAEDWSSEVMSKVFNDIGKYSVDNGNGIFSAWIKKVAKNSILDKIRKENKKERLISIDDNFGKESNDTTFFQVKNNELNIEESLIQNELNIEMQSKLKVALQNLSEFEKQLIDLRFYKNLSFTEIAQELNKTENYCLVKVHRLKNKLKEMLK